jgi:uncharacterized protein YeaO (DUF488 family)
MRVAVGRVYDPIGDQVGLRVLVDRLWPRGMTKARAGLAEWCREVAPTTELRHWYGHDPSRTAEFRARYEAELASGEPAISLAHLRELAAAGDLLLLTAAKEPGISHAAVLADLIRTDQVG